VSTLPTLRSSSPPEQGLRRPPELPPAAGVGGALELPEDTAGMAGIDLGCRSTSARIRSSVSRRSPQTCSSRVRRYFDMPTVCFRGGLPDRPQHAGAQLHGFLAYLMRCTVTGEPYTIFGYGGKQSGKHPCPRRRARVRRVSRQSTAGCVYNIGGGAREQRLDARGDRASASGSPDATDYTLSARRASAITAGGSPTCSVQGRSSRLAADVRDRDVLRDIHDRNAERWMAAASP